MSQAEYVARKLGSISRMPILISPVLRSRQSAAPLATLWGVFPVVEDAFAEIPAPSKDLFERGQWLQKFLESSWRDVPADLERWRSTFMAALSRQKSDVVVFTHFIGINVAFGAATGDDRVIAFRPDHGSISTFDTSDGVLTLVKRGRIASTRVI